MDAKRLWNYIDTYQIKTKSRNEAKLILAKLKTMDLPDDLVLLVEGNEVHGYIPQEIESRIEYDNDFGAWLYYSNIKDIIDSVN